jgi:cystinosin
MIPVAANDVAFSIHAVLLTAITLFQIVIYDVSGLHFVSVLLFSFRLLLKPDVTILSFEQRGNQKLSKISIATVCVVWLVAAVCFFIALPSHSWLWLISIFK